MTQQSPVRPFPYPLGFAVFALLFYLAGLYPWGVLYNWGHVPVEAWDWGKEHDYLDLLRQAQNERRVPYRTDYLYHGTDQFLGVPEWPLVPQTLLLPYCTNGQYFLWNAWILYTVSYAACLVAARRYQLGVAAFAFLALLVNFNGYITAHLSVGHTMWSGTFLLPWYVLALLEWVEKGPSPAISAKVALILWAMILVGHFHQVVWCWLFLVFFLGCNRAWWQQGLVTFLLSGLLAAFRFGPAALIFSRSQYHRYLSGYPTVLDLLSAFIELRSPHYPLEGIRMPIGWWEYDLYVGLIAFGALVAFGIVLRFSNDPALRPARYEALDGPLLLLTFATFSLSYLAIAGLPLPLVNGERVGSRFLIIPAQFIMFIAAIRLQRVLDKRPMTTTLAILLSTGLIETAITLFRHVEIWSVTTYGDVLNPAPPPRAAVTDAQPQLSYFWVVQICWGITLATVPVALYLLWRGRAAPPPAPLLEKQPDT